MDLEDRRAILKRLVSEYGLDLVAAYSAKKNEAKIKKVKVFKENKIDDVLKQELTTEQYLERIDAGYYDDGYVICCGIIRRGRYQGFKFAYVDIDKKIGLYLFLTHGDRSTTIEQIADSQWVEYNGIDRDQHVHIPYILEPDVELSAKGADDVVGIEVNINGVMFSVGAPHHNGGFYQLLGKSDKIRVIDKTLAFALQERVRSVCEYKGVHYFDKNNDEQKTAFHQAYSAHLHDDGTRIKKGGRHETIKFICCSYFNKYESEWDNLTDDQRKERALGFDKLKCEPPLHETDPIEFEELWKWTQKTFRVDRDKKKEEREDVRRQTETKYKDDLNGLSEGKQQLFRGYQEEVRQALSGNVWCQLEKDQWLLADKKDNIMYKCYFVSKQYEDGHEYIVFHKDVRLFKAIAIKWIKHEMPLEFLNAQATYTVTFRNTLNNTFVLARKTMDQIVDWLKNEGYILPQGRRGGSPSEILGAMLDAFREDGKLEIDRSISSTGIYYLDGKITFVGLDEYLEDYKKQDIEERKTAIKFIEDLVCKFKTDIVPTALKVGTMAPFDFALKQYTDDVVYVRSIWAYGWPRTGKSTIAMIPAGMYFKWLSPARKQPYVSINTEARLGYFVSRDTLPLSIFELKALNNPKDPKATIMLEMFKSVIETQEARGTMNIQSTFKTRWPSFSQINFSSNPRPPLDPALRARIIEMNFTQKDRHTKSEKKAYHEFMANARYFRTLGNFVLGYIHDHPEIIFKTGEINWEDCAKDIITIFYQLTGFERPAWLDLPLSNDSGTEEEGGDDYEIDEINNTAGALKTVFKNHFNEEYNRYIRNLGDKIETSNGYTEAKTLLTLKERIDFCISQEITPYFSRNKAGRLIIPNNIFSLLQNGGIESDSIGSLRSLSEILDMDYGPLSLNNKKIKCVYGNIQQLYDFLTEGDYTEIAQTMGDT